MLFDAVDFDQIQKEKQLNFLLNKAFKIQSIGDFVCLIGHQASSIKKKLGEIILCCQSAYYGPRQYCMKGTRLYERASKKTWPHVSKKRNCYLEDSLYLANDLGRPFNKVLSLPLQTPYEKEENPPVLFIEYFSKAQTIENIFYDEKWKILQAAFSKILLEEHWKSGFDLWKHTFDGLKEPLVILDKNEKPVRYNVHYQQLLDEDKSILNKKIFKKNEKIFEKNSYPIMNEGEAYNIEHFVNITSRLYLREQIAKRQRMSTLGKVADDIAHNLNNPLTGIRSMAQILAEEESMPEIKSNFCEIESATKRCQNIIQNFIRFSKPSSFNSQCEVNEIIHQTIPFLKTLIQSKKLILHLDSEESLVKAQPCLLQQVMFNLIKNALQAVDSKGKVIVESKIQSESVKIQVKDNGCGIESHHLHLLFEPFFTTKEEGTGLGLRISKQIINKFEGELHCESEKGKGSCFSFVLALA